MGQERAIGYVRVSTDEQHVSPEDQRRRIAAWCDAFAHELVAIYADEGVSGSVPLAERPEGQHVAALLEPRRGKPNGVDALVVTRLDRLSRGQDAHGLLEWFTNDRGRRHAPPRLVALDEHLDMSSAFGRMAARLRVDFAIFERELIGERTSAALAHRRAEGRAYGQVPYGWDRDDDTLVPNPDEQAAIVRMRELRDQGHADHAIARALNDEHVPTKRGGRWQANTVYRILARELGASG